MNVQSPGAHMISTAVSKLLEWWGTDVVICLEWGANDLHMFQLMPLPPHQLLKSRMVYLSGAGLPMLSWKKAV